ncbi:MAG: MaoC family dehydratase [Dehalococcoidia bacterium]
MEYDRRDTFGRYLEDFKVGDVYKHWPGRTVTEYDDMLFSMLTMNHNPLHIDAHYMEDSRFGKRLVNGAFILSLIVGMSVPDVSGKAIANLEYESIKHLAPTFHGDTIYAETTVLEVTESKSKPDRGVVYVESRGYNQRGETVITLRRKALIPKKNAKI